MLPKAEIRLLQSLHNKRDRKEKGLFLAEGEKIIEELIEHKYPVKKFYATDEWSHASHIAVERITEEELKKISTLTTPNKVVALCEQKKGDPEMLKTSDWIFAFDDLQDPGNLGTIIRIADWFGISSIVCSVNSVDMYNPKVIQSTMGSFIGLDIFYTDLLSFLEDRKRSNVPVYGTTLSGEPVGKAKLEPGIVVFGNESSGISDEILQVLDKEILLPAFGTPVAESLNVAVTAAAFAALIRTLR